MRKKPRLVIIGEAHPSGLEAVFGAQGRLRLKIKEENGYNRWVVDRSADPEEAKRSIQLINKEILQEEARILKKEGVVRLFVEKDDDEQNRELYGRYRLTHDFKQLKVALRRNQEKRYAKAMNDAKVLLSALDMPPMLRKCYGLVLSPVHSIFGQSLAVVIYRAGIFDIVPVDDADSGWKLLMINTADTLLSECSIALAGLIDQSQNKEEIKDAIDAANRFSAALNKQASSLNGKREKKISERIRQEYLPGSALICGTGHVEPLKELLSKEFSIQTYSVGNELYAEGNKEKSKGLARSILSHINHSLFSKKGHAPKSR